MKGFKLILSLLLMLSLLVMTVAGCSGSKETSDSGSGSSETAENDESEAEEETNDNQGASTEEKHHFKAMVKENSGAYVKFADRDKYIAWQGLMELFDQKGLEVEWDIVQADQYATTLATTLASDDMPEYLTLSDANFATCVSCIENGTLVAVNDFIENGDGTAKDFLERYPEVYKKATYTDGKMYWIPGLQESYYGGQLNSTGVGMLIRKDWLDALGMEMPDTIDEFTAYLKACQEQDVNGNGIADEYLTIQATGFYTGLAEWFGLPNSTFNMNQDGEILNGWTGEGSKEYFRYMKQLVDEGLISPDFVAGDSTLIDTANANNQASAVYNWVMEDWLEYEITVQDGAADAMYVAMKPIQAMDGVEPLVCVEPPQLVDWVRAGFTKNLQDEKAASIFLDILYSDEYAILDTYGVEGKTYEVGDDGIEYLIGDATVGSDQVAAMSGSSVGKVLWGGALMQVRLTDIESELVAITPEKADAQIALFNPSNVCYTERMNYMAVPTIEESETLDKYETDYNALSDEISVQILKGEINIDADWDAKVIAPLEDAGMKEIEEVYRARADRFNSAE